MKSEIIKELGETEILLPSLIAEGLSANDCVKVRLSVLQAAAQHTRNRAPFALSDECRAADLDAVSMEKLVNGAVQSADGRMTAPELGALVNGIWHEVETMARAVSAGAADEGEQAFHRLAALQKATVAEASDTIAVSQVAKLTAISDQGEDSLHRLVMDLHKALNRLSVSHAEEVLFGAHVSGLLPQDKPAVEAFMRGVESTRKLKFDHPGLATIAARSGERLVIQNDIGETDAHVVMVAVEPAAVTITYTDVHLARAKFFTGLFRKFPVEWSGLDHKKVPGLGDDGVFYLVTGRLSVEAPEDRDAFVEAVGASLVFLIDWNKARKILRTWVSKGDAIQILDWAARHRIGHRGFLELGGGELVSSAVHHAAPTRIGFGERLDSALGRESAVDFLKTVLRSSAEALLGGGSARLARDRIEADLVRHLKRVDTMLLAVVIRQAGLARHIAADISRCVATQREHGDFDRAALAQKARRMEVKGDRIALEARSEVARFDADPGIERLVNSIEDAIDELEQAAFVTSLLPKSVPLDLLAPLADLCAAAITGTEAAAAGTAAAVDLPEGQRVDSEDALAAVGRLLEAEHNGDAAERAVMAIIMRSDFDMKTALVALELARALERATDRLAGFGHLLRKLVLSELST